MTNKGGNNISRVTIFNLSKHQILWKLPENIVDTYPIRLTLADRKEESEASSVILQTDVRTLEAAVARLEEAVSEASSPTVRKLTKKYSVV